MSVDRTFEIAYVGLKPGIHHFSYDITDSFFKKFAEQDFTDAQLKVNLWFDKKSVHTFIIKMDVDGTITDLCDRCCDPLQIRVWEEYTMMVKLVNAEDADNLDEQDPEVIHFPRSESIMDVAEWIYEFIILSLPIQKIHQEDSNGISPCNPEVLKHISNIKETTEQPQKLTALQEQLQKIKTQKDAKS